MSQRRRSSLLAVTALVGAGVASTIAGAGVPGPCAKPAPMTFSPQTFVDQTRAGGEPMIQTHPDGTLLYGSHAGTTHFFSPAVADPTSLAFAQNYKGQTYFWYSKDNGATWTFVDRTLPPDNDPMSGFSDPDFAIDAAGNVYLSEINLANVAVSKSTNVAEGFVLQNFFAQILSDRQWKEADTENRVYMVGNVVSGGTFPGQLTGASGHTLFVTDDGGETWADGINPNPGGLGDLRVDKRDGTLYEASFPNQGGELQLVAFRKARSGDMTPDEPVVIAESVNMLAHWPSFDLDPQGNLYMTWDERGGEDAEREAGIWYAYSTDQGRTWSKPSLVAGGPTTKLWPWLAVGDAGRVGIAWFEADAELPDNDAETAGSHAWRVHAAQTINGLGCSDSKTPGFTTTVVTADPIHTGTMCQGGTTCQAFAIDRRLGDYFAIEIDPSGALVAAYSDTSQGGSISLPGFARQNGGPSFFGKAAAAPAKPVTQPKPTAPKPVDPRPGTGVLPVTGMNTALGGLAALLLAGTAFAVRRRRTT